MTPSDFPNPHPTPIDEVSPSLANQLHACALRVGFSRDPDLRAWRRPTTHTELGLIAHAVVETVYKRKSWALDPEEIQAELQLLWDSELAKGVVHLAAAWAPANPPPPEEWPGYALTRVRTIRRCSKLLAPTPVAPKRDKIPGVGIEIELRDTESGLYGRADRIEKAGDSTRVIDLKTGMNQEEPTDDQRRQLLLYAVLVHRTTGVWPSSVGVEDASGNIYEIPLAPTSAESVLAETVEAVRLFNEAIDSDSLMAHASPSAERCRWCAFRPVCGPFWLAVQTDWDQRSAMGEVADSGGEGAARFVKLLVQSPNDRAGTTVHVAGLSDDIPGDATHVAVIDWNGATEGGDVRARWSTRIRTW